MLLGSSKMSITYNLDQFIYVFDIFTVNLE